MATEMATSGLQVSSALAFGERSMKYAPWRLPWEMERRAQNLGSPTPPFCLCAPGGSRTLCPRLRVHGPDPPASAASILLAGGDSLGKQGFFAKAWYLLVAFGTCRNCY